MRDTEYACGTCGDLENECECRKVKSPRQMTVEELRRTFPVERACCGTLPGSHHRVNCSKYRGKHRQPPTTHVTKMDKLQRLLARCKCGVYLEINIHRDVYETAEQHLDTLEKLGFPVEDEAVKKRMIETNTVVDLHFYPDTPIGFYKVLHHDLDAALDEALACLPNESGTD